MWFFGLLYQRALSNFRVTCAQGIFWELPVTFVSCILLAQAALDKAIKNKEEWTEKLTTAIEVYGNYKGRDESPPKRKT